MVELGRLGRLGRWAADHLRLVAGGWLVVFLGLGALAPQAEHALLGAGRPSDRSRWKHGR